MGDGDSDSDVDVDVDVDVNVEGEGEGEGEGDGDADGGYLRILFLSTMLDCGAESLPRVFPSSYSPSIPSMPV